MPRSKKKSNRLATTVSDPVAMCGEIACIDACCGGSAPYKCYARATQLREITMTECLRRSRQWTGVEARHGLSTGRTALCIRRYRLRWRMRAEGIAWPRPRRFLLDMIGSIGRKSTRRKDGLLILYYCFVFWHLEEKSCEQQKRQVRWASDDLLRYAARR